METRKKISAAALYVAALLLLSGCAMKRDVQIVEEKIDAVRADQQQMKNTMARLDSLLNTQSQASLEMRAQMRSDLSSMQEQLQSMNANISDLQDKVNGLVGNQGGRVTMTPPQTSLDTGGVTSPGPPPGVDCQSLYDDSFINLRRGQYDASAKGFGDYLKYCGSQGQAADARFWMGESYYSMDKYKEAIVQFDSLLTVYSKSEKRPGALFKIARSYEELGQKKEARTYYKKLVDEYPETLEASQAKDKLKELK